jgi:sugar-specific transcriptional regulator TrmB
MTTIEQLQQIGLNKYEAEAYYTLLIHKPLTGYEVGKRSQVPLSRSYEILERLVEKGLALVQPGDPPRYTAQDPRQFLHRIRSEMEATLEVLTSALTTLPPPGNEGEFWVARGRQHIFARLHALIEGVQLTLNLSIPARYTDELTDALAQARARGCHVILSPDSHTEGLIALRDNEEALVGTLAPAETCQVIVSTNQVLVHALRGYFTASQYTHSPLIGSVPAPVDSEPQDRDWIDWEAHKQQRLWKLSKPHRVA